MNKAATAKPKENRLIKYLKDTRAELRKVTWPTPTEARNLTTIVLVVTVVMAIFLWLLDLLFGGLMGMLIG